MNADVLDAIERLGVTRVCHLTPLRNLVHIATGAGVLGVLHPIVAAVVAVLWLTLSRLTGKAAVASIASAHTCCSAPETGICICSMCARVMGPSRCTS